MIDLNTQAYLFHISNRVNQRYFCLAKLFNPADQNKCLIKYRPNR